MKTRHLITGAMSMIAMVGLGAQPGLADLEYGSAHPPASGHACCEEMTGHHGHAADHLRHLLQHQQAIGLTEEQVKKLKTVELDYDRARIKADAEIRVAERELLALVEDEKTDLSVLEAKVKQSEMLEVGLRMSTFKARRDALAVLTPEQREKAKASHEKRMQEMRSSPEGPRPAEVTNRLQENHRRTML